jgi:hypothetical protein
MIDLTLTEPQHKFLALDCKFPAFVAGFGTGKSEVMCNDALLDSIEGGSNSLIALYEPTYDLVRLILAPRMEEKLIDWGINYKYNKSENIIYTSSSQLGDFVLRTLDNPSRIVGYESFRAKIDELDTLKKEHAQEAWNKIIARNRQKPDTYRKTSNKPINTVAAFTTPEGFRFVYDRWKRNPTENYQMVQASTLSNPFLPDDYVEALRETYPEQLIEAYIKGEFVNLKGGTVYRVFDRRENHTDITENDYETLHIGMDFNVGKMSAIVHVERDSDPIAVNEIFGLLDTEEMIAEIDRLYPGRTIYVYPDSSGKNRKSVNASETDISKLEDAGYSLRYDSVNPFVRDRINAMNAMLCNSKGVRRYKINTNLCPRYTDDLEQQVYNKQGEPDKAHDQDHMPDAGGYYIAYAFPIIKPISSVSYQWQN